jgi:hypothetical protein
MSSLAYKSQKVRRVSYLCALFFFLITPNAQLEINEKFQHTEITLHCSVSSIFRFFQLTFIKSLEGKEIAIHEEQYLRGLLSLRGNQILFYCDKIFYYPGYRIF